MADCVCLYALVTGRGSPLRVRGMAGERLRQVRLGGIDAIVGLQRRPPKPTLAALREYDRVERELLDSYAGVLPARFGTCAAGIAQLDAVVRDRQTALRRGLRLVRGRVQMTVRIFGVRPGSDRGRTGVRPRSEYEYGTTQGTQYLRGRANALHIAESRPLQAAVARWVRAERTERHDQGRLVGSLYHLIPRRAATAYRRALERAALDAGLTTIVSGPWPPYAFAV